jgi:UPF0271 protein
MFYQLGALHGIASVYGAKVRHISFHGALGNMAAEDDDLALLLLSAAKDFDPELIVSSSPRGAAARVATKLGMPLARKFLADRAYDDQGLLVSRANPGAVIKDGREVLHRVIQVLSERTVISIAGNTIPMAVNQILLHSDTPGAVSLGRLIGQAIEESGCTLTPISKILAGSSA